MGKKWIGHKKKWILWIGKSGLDTKKSGWKWIEKVDWTRKKVDGSGLKKWIGHEKRKCADQNWNTGGGGDFLSDDIGDFFREGRG